MSSFQQALSEHPAPRRLGDVRLSFDQRILLGEAGPLGGRWRATVVVVTAAAFALSAAALVLTAEVAPWLAAVLATGAASCLWVSRQLERRSRRRRRFVVHFAAEQLRIERPAARGWRLDARWVPFDDIHDVTVRSALTGARLAVAWTDARANAFEAVLIEAVPEVELEALYRFRLTLGAAFGLALR